MKKLLVLMLIFSSLFFFTGCYGELEIIIDSPIVVDPVFGRYQGAIFNETEYTLRIEVEDVSQAKVVSNIVLSPGQHAYLKLAEKRYRFSATRAYSGERHASTNLHINGVKSDAYYNGSYYDWFVAFGRRMEVHP